MNQIFLRILPYLIIVVMGVVLYGMFSHYKSTIEDLQETVVILQTQKAEVENNYSSLKEIYNISLTQIEELRKSEKQSLEYIAEYERQLHDIEFGTEYDKDSVKLLANINEYERCWAKNFNNPSTKCKLEFAK